MSAASIRRIGDSLNDSQLKQKIVFQFVLLCSSMPVFAFLCFSLRFCHCFHAVISACDAGCVFACIISFLSHPLAARAWAQITSCFPFSTAALLFPFSTAALLFPNTAADLPAYLLPRPCRARAARFSKKLLICPCFLNFSFFSFNYIFHFWEIFL
ncbi:hypothetical protein MmiAt1_05430 [Methanimicrococcus sp. At1]|uniref:Uncharacterized protein n=1 Tax=Methanimicrococcus hacksteinii TaxID=3028293 RepID=A0ABU3VNK0_9EURY|nr:hypothetical protein [Methanimicrococcus sp. At1]